jgi:hypothetical protein
VSRLAKDMFNPNSEAYRYGCIAVIEAMLIGMSAENQRLFLTGVIEMIAKRQITMKVKKEEYDEWLW